MLDAVGNEVARALELETRIGRGVRSCRLHVALIDVLAVAVEDVKEILLGVRVRHGKETVVETQLGGHGRGRVKPVDGGLGLHRIGAFRTGLGLRQVLGVHAGDAPVGILFKGRGHDHVAVAQAHRLGRRPVGGNRQAPVTLRGNLGEVVLLDPQIAGERNLALAHLGVVRVIFNLEDLRLPLGIVRHGQAQGMQHGHGARGGIVEVLTQAVLEECRSWVARGAGDITLLGQNVNVFGNDKSGDGTTFPELLRQVAAIPGLRRIRFVSAHPRDFSQETIDMFAELPQLCPRLHLPLQSGSDSMLKKMGRGYTMERYLSVVEGLRKARPDIALSTDLIVGFPSETEEEFEDTLKAVDSCGFMSSFSFCYSDRPGTRASAMPFKIPHDVQLERLERLQSLQNDRAEAWLKSRVGLVTDVLLEGPSQRRTEDNNEWQGRDPWGDMVNVRMPEGEGRPGQFVDVKIDRALKHSLKASPVNREA